MSTMQDILGGGGGGDGGSETYTQPPGPPQSDEPRYLNVPTSDSPPPPGFVPNQPQPRGSYGQGSLGYAPAVRGAGGAGSGGGKQPTAKQLQKGETYLGARALMWFFFVVGLSFFVLAFLGSIFHYVSFNRTHVLAGDAADPPIESEMSDDTPTRFTAANILGAPLQQPALFFGGFLVAYIFARMIDSKHVVGYIGWIEYAAFLIVATFAIVWLAFFARLQSRLETQANRDHSLSDEEYMWESEGNIPYELYWFVSPLESWVWGHNLYMLIASAIAILGITIAFIWQAATGRQGRQLYGEEARALLRPNEVSGLRQGILYFFFVLTALLVATCTSQALLVLFTAMSDVMTADQSIGMTTTPLVYWMTHVQTVHVALFFFYAGWFAMFLVARSWWVYPSYSSTERRWSLASAFVSSLVGLVVGIFGIFYLFEMQFSECADETFSPIEGDSTLKIGVCHLIRKEKDTTSGGNFGVTVWLRVNAWFFVITTWILFALSLYSLISIWSEPVREKGESIALLRSEASVVSGKKKRTSVFANFAYTYDKDSGEDTAAEIDPKQLAVGAARQRRSGGNFFEEIDLSQ